MNLSPIARRVKIRISSGGTSHADLDSLLRRFSLSDLLPLISDGRLSRWLIQIGEPAKAAALDSLHDCNLTDAATIKSILHIFYDFEALADLAAKWKRNRLSQNLDSLRLEALLSDDLQLALYFASKELQGVDKPDADFWRNILAHHHPSNAEQAAKLIPLLRKVNLSSRAKTLAREFDYDENVRRLRFEENNEAIVKQLNLWLSNIRFFYDCNPQIALENKEDAELLNQALFTISCANRNYYSKNADEHGERYRPSMIMGKMAIIKLIKSPARQKFMQVFRLIAYICKMQFIDKGGSINTGFIPVLSCLAIRLLHIRQK